MTCPHKKSNYWAKEKDYLTELFSLIIIESFSIYSSMYLYIKGEVIYFGVSIALVIFVLIYFLSDGRNSTPNLAKSLFPAIVTIKKVRC